MEKLVFLDMCVEIEKSLAWNFEIDSLKELTGIASTVGSPMLLF
jgi:hypothetical protein